MADLKPKHQAEQGCIGQSNERSLKYLDFVETGVIYVMVWFWGVYELAKGSAGPLKPGVQKIEDAVRAVFGPLFDKLWHVPFHLLRFVDHKVDEYVFEVERHVPSLVKHTSGHVRAVASEVHRTGAVNAAKGLARATYDRCEPAARELIVKYEPVAEKYAVSAWGYLNRLPLAPEVAQIAVPTAAYCAGRYNQGVSLGTERGYAVTRYLPLIPTKKIAKIFEEKGSDNGPEASINGGGVIQAQ